MEKKPNRPTEAGFVIRLLRRLQAGRVPVAATAGAEPPRTVLDTDKFHYAKNGAWMESRLRGNERIWAGFREIELRMLAAETLSAVIEILTRDLPAFFPGVHAVSIAWLDPDYELTRLLEQEGGTATKLPFVALRPSLSGQVSPVPVLGAVDAASWQRLFPHAPQPLQSAAIVPLVLRGEQVGSLNQGSADPHHFTPDAATDLLEHLAAVTAICIDAAVNRARLRRDGLTDMLTQVANRRFFDRRLREEISQWLRRGGELSCLLVDLDHFKQINDQHGHQAGDLVLQEVARTLSKGLRTSDVLARYGGEEFVLLLPATGSARAAEIAERLRSAVASLVLTPARAVSLRVTASFGLASLAAEQRAALEDPGLWLLRRADQALYSAKARGRNCVVTAPGPEAGNPPPLPVYPAASRER
jgi:two-component system, cell cycle response regulator